MSFNLSFILIIGILLNMVLWIENCLLEALGLIQGVLDPCLLGVWQVKPHPQTASNASQVFKEVFTCL